MPIEAFKEFRVITDQNIKQQGDESSRYGENSDGKMDKKYINFIEKYLKAQYILHKDNPKPITVLNYTKYVEPLCASRKSNHKKLNNK